MVDTTYESDSGGGAGGGGGGVTDHGALTGLADDDHTQYHNDTRGDARYHQQGGTDVPVADGGTGASTAADARIALDVPQDGETMGCVVHGATAGTARPTGFAAVTWIGSVEPTNATNNDVWVDTT